MSDGPPPIPDIAYTDPVAYSLTLDPIYHLTPAYGAITDDNHGGYVVIVAWIMMCFFSLSVLTRLLTRYIPITLGGWDDFLSGVSMVFGIAQTAVIYRSATHGLGRDQSTLSPAAFESFAKAYYTANLLYILTITFAKASLVFLIVRLSPARSVRQICYGLLGLIGLWCIVFLFLFAFQNPMPAPWNYTTTPNFSISGLYYALGITDILTDLFVTLLPAYVIWNVQIPFRKRVTVIAVFASRLVVPILAAVRLSTLPNYLNSTNNKSWEAVTPQSWTQVVMCVSIITACIPCLKPFLESLESGFMDMSMAQRSGATYGGASSGSGRHRGGNGKSGGSKGGSKVNESYVLSSFNSSGRGNSAMGHHQNHEVDSHSKASEMYKGRNRYQTEKDVDTIDGAYLDVNSSSANSTSNVRRHASVTESERALTGKSSNGSAEDVVRSAEGFDFSQIGGIKVTREVEVRNEDEEQGVHDYGVYGRRW